MSDPLTVFMINRYCILGSPAGEASLDFRDASAFQPAAGELDLK